MLQRAWWSRGFGASLVLVALPVVSCGGDSKPNTEGGSGGGAQTGAAGATGGTDLGGTSEPPVAAHSACARYIESMCQRDIECGILEGSLQSCVWTLIERCPDVLFSPGSARTPEGVIACADEYAAHPCDELRAERLPACVSPGTRGAGEACKYASQCESLTCSAEFTPACGQCVALVQPGESCNDERVCPLGETCESGECVPNELPAPPPVRQEDEPCSSAGTTVCADGLQCLPIADGESSRTCRTPPAPDQPCVTPRTGGGECRPDSYCDGDGICRLKPPLGQPCGSGGGDLPRSYCADGLLCSSGTCTAPATLGEPCDGPSERLYRSNCEAELVCACADEACTAGVCSRWARATERCDAPHTVCPPGSECVAGWCAGDSTLTKYAEVCEE